MVSQRVCHTHSATGLRAACKMRGPVRVRLCRGGTSALSPVLSPTSDIGRRRRHGSSVPLPDSCSAADRILFDDLVGALLEKQGTSSPSALAALRLMTSLNLTGGLDGELARLGTLEDMIGIGRRAPKIIESGQPRRITGRRVPPSNETDKRREAVASGQRGDLRTMGGPESIRHHDQAAIRLACLSANDRFEFCVSPTGAAIASTAKDIAAALKGCR